VTSSESFGGFPGVSRGTAIPNVFFSAVLPRLGSVDSLLAFLWASYAVQEMRGDARFVSPEQIWAMDGAAAAFEQLGHGREGLDAGLRDCVEAGAMIALDISGEGATETVYFVNNPGSRRTVARALAGDLQLRPQSVATPVAREARPSIFRLYEENIGTITPIVGERLIAAAEQYPQHWIEDAFREAAMLNARNWRYIERILENWSREGRTDEAPGRDSLEQRKKKYLGGQFGHLSQYR
jgi:DnaD/phage-associated family protein